MKLKCLWGINFVIALVVLWLYALYGRLHWWYIKLSRTHNIEDRQISEAFWVNADQMRVICLILAFVVLVANTLLWRLSTRNSWFEGCVCAVSTLVFIVCLVVTF